MDVVFRETRNMLTHPSLHCSRGRCEVQSAWVARRTPFMRRVDSAVAGALRPPAIRDSAAELVREQLAYCERVGVHPGVVAELFHTRRRTGEASDPAHAALRLVLLHEGLRALEHRIYGTAADVEQRTIRSGDLWLGTEQPAALE